MITFGGHLNPTDSAMIGIKNFTFAGVSIGNITSSPLCNALACTLMARFKEKISYQIKSTIKYKTQNTL